MNYQRAVIKYQGDRTEGNELGYETIAFAITGGKYGLCSSIMVDKGDEAEFITVRLRFDEQHIRLVLVYGPQENDSVNKIRDFYDSVSVQVERVNLAGDSVFLVGDFNAKLGAEIIRGEIHQMSNNGVRLNGIMEKCNLAVLNALEICSGTFT